MYPYQVKAKRYNGKVFTANNFTETSELLKLDWKNTIITDRQINILLNFLQNKSLTADDVKECLKLNQDNSRNKKPILESTTLWDYPKQSYGTKKKGNNKYAGVTPAHVIYNMVKRYTERGDLAVDPMCGSGTTIDVCEEENRQCIGYDVVPTRQDIIKNDSRTIPLKKIRSIWSF